MKVGESGTGTEAVSAQGCCWWQRKCWKVFLPHHGAHHQ